MRETDKDELVGLIAELFILLVLACIMGLAFGLIGRAADASTTETTVISEPSEVSVPEPTETIHIETTEAESEPTVVTGSFSEAPSASVSEDKVVEVSKEDVELLACVIYQEAGGNGSCDNCRRYVADIVLNRVNDPRFPNDIHGVLTAESQYGKFHWTGVVWPERALYPGEADAVARAYQIAEEVLSGKHSDLYGNGYIWQAGFEQGSDGFWCCGHFYGR